MSNHVAVFAFPFGTHAAPLLAVVRRLAASSPSTHFSFFSTQQSNSSIFSVYKQNMDFMQSNIKAYDVSDGVPEGHVFSGNPLERIELFMKFSSWRRRSRVVWLPFWTAGPNSLAAHVYTDLIRETFGAGGMVGREDETLSLVQGMSKIRTCDLPEGVLFGNTESFFSIMLHKMGKALPRAAAVFINSFEELDPGITECLKSKLKRFLNIGPSNLIFGSVATPPPHELVAVAEALETSEIPFIWSLKDNSKVSLDSVFQSWNLDDLLARETSFFHSSSALSFPLVECANISSETQNPSMETSHFDQKTGRFNFGERKGKREGLLDNMGLVEKQKRADNNAFVVLEFL
ncbi:hypothetical protein OIU85_004121 [Salix viminalis]|uniref:Uncharacterized protein n=1 Tax=Salix viminalis TaxID=40686 RepID=A0A9Q0SY23_SALVM|nr:hypothetical protein OIU85_004121 [Salix viminalis]